MESIYHENQRVLNIGIFAHVDAGKTTITEHLLYSRGAKDALGRVDHGDTTTDDLAQERKRGITIRAAAISFTLGDLKVNLVDTPGHADFVAEVERSMAILDGAILVLSAKEGVQGHSYLLFQSLKRLGIPSLVFINKIDRQGADVDGVVAEIRRSLSGNIAPVQVVTGQGTRETAVSAVFECCLDEATELAAEFDEDIFADYADDREISPRRVRDLLARLSRDGAIHPVLAVRRNLQDVRQHYVVMESGAVHVRDLVAGGKVAALGGLRDGEEVPTSMLKAGDMGILYGADLEVGSPIGPVRRREEVSLGTPTLKVGAQPRDVDRQHDLVRAIERIAEADPVLKHELSEVSGEVYLNLFGAVQMEILEESLREVHGVDVEFTEPMVIYRETPSGTGSAAMETISTLGLEVSAGAPGSGVKIDRAVRSGDLPGTMWNGIEDGIRLAVRQGLKGWEVTDLRVTITRTEICPVTTPAHFRDLAPMLVLEALDKAGTRLLWPVLNFELRAPRESYGRIASDLLKMRAHFDEPANLEETMVITGTIPVETSRTYPLALADHTGGKGMMATWFSGYEDADPRIHRERPKIYPDPLNKTVYIMSKKGMVSRNA